jgi:hypothetical protein
MKAKTLLVAAVMFLGLSAAAFAQATFQVGSIPVTAITASGHTEATGSVTFTVLAPTVSSVGTIQITYPVPITNTISTANNLINCTAGGGGSCVGLAINLIASTNTGGLIVINVPATLTAGTTFTIGNVRVSAVGYSGSNVTATISTVNNAIVAGQTTVIVVNSVPAGLVAGSSTTGVLNNTSGATVTAPDMVWKEGYLNAFNDFATNYGGGTYPLVIRFTVTGTIPTGLTVSMPANFTTTGSSNGGALWVPCNSDGTTAGAAAKAFISTDAAPLYAYYQLASGSDPQRVESIHVVPTFAATAASLPLPAISLTMTATFAPIGNAFGASNAILPGVPRFAAAEVAADKPLVAIGASNTVVLIPYASRITASGYDTGLAVANTTTDPGTTVMGFTKAVAQTNTATFYFYPQQVGSTAGTPWSLATGATSSGTGLNASGQIPSGSSYTVLLSQLIADAQHTQTVPNDFQGYIIIITGFTNAHVQYFISDFRTFSNGGQGMVLNHDFALGFGGGRTLTPEGVTH